MIKTIINSNKSRIEIEKKKTKSIIVAHFFNENELKQTLIFRYNFKKKGLEDTNSKTS